jgi:hypothetical protein
MIAAARPNLGEWNPKELDELLTEYRTSAMKSDDYGRTDRVYHRKVMG